MIILIITTKEIIGNLIAQYPKPKTITLEKPQLQTCQNKMQSYIVAPMHIWSQTLRNSSLLHRSCEALWTMHSLHSVEINIENISVICFSQISLNSKFSVCICCKYAFHYMQHMMKYYQIYLKSCTYIACPVKSVRIEKFIPKFDDCVKMFGKTINAMVHGRGRHGAWQLIRINIRRTYFQPLGAFPKKNALFPVVLPWGAFGSPQEWWALKFISIINFTVDPPRTEYTVTATLIIFNFFAL